MHNDLFKGSIQRLFLYACSCSRDDWNICCSVKLCFVASATKVRYDGRKAYKQDLKRAMEVTSSVGFSFIRI